MKPVEINLNERQITFRKVTAGHYRNEETGVEIVKTPARRVGRGGYRVAGWSITAPTHSSNGYISRSEVGFEVTKAAATVPATRIALATREQTARAFTEAWAELAEREVAAAHAALDPKTGDERECGAHYGEKGNRNDLTSETHTATCRRPQGHPRFVQDGIGHAPVKYPQGTPEYAAYSAKLHAALAEWRQVDEDPAPAQLLPTADGRGFYNAAAQEHYNNAYRLTGDRASALARLHDEASAARSDHGVNCPAAYGAGECTNTLDCRPVQLGDLSDAAGFADRTRMQVRIGILTAPAAWTRLMAELGVTEEGAQALLAAPTTAALA